MTDAIPLGDLQGGRSLYADCWEGTDAFRSLVPLHFRDPGCFEKQAGRIDAARYDRKALAAVLRDQNIGFGAPAASLGRIEELKEPGALAVIGGQQAGLFGGPLYTLFKALTVLSLSERLGAKLGRPVIPLFWIASEDSDLAEVNHAFLTDASGHLQRLDLPGSPAENLPVSRILLGQGVRQALDALSAMLPDTEYTAEVMAALARAYSPGASYPAAFGAWMQYALGDRGLVMVDAADPRLKAMASGLFRREVEGKGAVARAVLGQNVKLEKAGFKPRITLRDGMLTLFFQDPARDVIAVAGEGFALKSGARSFSPEELSHLVESNPEMFSPNAALRPLFQDLVFPTLAVVLGPSELAYYTQLTGAYEDLGVVMPVLFPRASMTLIDAKTSRLLESCGLSLSDVLKDNAGLPNRLAAGEVPPSLAGGYAAAKLEVRRIWSGLAEATAALDPTLAPTARNAMAGSVGRFEWMEKKILKAIRTKNSVLSDRLLRLNASLYPGGGLQERALGPAQFLARSGRAVIDAAYRALDPFAAEHRGVRLPQ